MKKLFTLSALTLAALSANAQLNHTIVGTGATASGHVNQVVVGTDAKGLGPNSTSVGHNASAKINGTAVGSNATANANSASFGSSAQATGVGSLSVGNESSASGDHAVAVGRLSNASGLAATAVGRSASATAEHSEAYGMEAKSTAKHAIQFGRGVNDEEYTVQFGDGTEDGAMRLRGVADGAKDNDAATVRQVNNIATTAAGAAADVQSNLDETNENVSTLATTVDNNADETAQQLVVVEGRAVVQANTYTDRQINALEQRTDRKIDAVGAMAMATLSIGGVVPTAEDKTFVGVGVGRYGSSSAVSVGVTHFVTPKLRFTGAVSKATGGKTGFGAGVAFGF